MKAALKPAVFLIALIAVVVPAFAQETQIFTDFSGAAVEIPVNPKRIVALHDLSLTVPLTELGILPVGAVGRTGSDGKRYLRGAATLTGVDFANSTIADVGGFPSDLEAIAALEPDLIIMMPFNTTDRGQLERIAPTILLEYNTLGDFLTLEQLSKITGTQDRLATLKNRYEGQLAQIKKMIDAENMSVSVFGPFDGQLVAWNTYGAIGKVLRDADFQSPAIIDAIEGSDRVNFTPEYLLDFDADYIITTYDHVGGQSPKTVVAELEKMLPGFCEQLQACREGRMIFLPREDALTRSYEALGQMSAVVMAVIGGQGYAPASR